MRLRIELYSEITKTNLKTWALLDAIEPQTNSAEYLKDLINKTHQIDSNQH